MATFSRTTFDAAAYLAFRPSYPRWVHDKVLLYHFGPRPNGKSSLALDLGCGPGISTISLLPHFDRVIGLDPSAKMVDAAITPTTPNLPRHLIPNIADGKKGKLGKVEYRQGYSEELGFLEDGSVDLVTAGQAAHWFDYPKFWREITRVLRPGGSVCLYGYPDFFLPDFPQHDRCSIAFRFETDRLRHLRIHRGQRWIRLASTGSNPADRSSTKAFRPSPSPQHTRTSPRTGTLPRHSKEPSPPRDFPRTKFGPNGLPSPPPPSPPSWTRK